MPDAVRILHASDPGWNRALEGAPHDFFHTAIHHSAWEAAGTKQAFIAVVQHGEKSVAWPYLLRPIETAGGFPTGRFDITSVDGYAGPVYRGCEAGDSFAGAAIAVIFAHWRASGVVSVFTRFHPLLGNHAGIDGLRHQGHTVSIDLQLSDELAWAQYRENHRRQIRKASRQGLTVQADHSREGFLDFVRLYHATMRRNNADAHYFFDENFLAHLRDDQRGDGTIHTARLNNRVVGAALITEFQGIVQYLLGGVEEDAQSLSPLKALLEGVRRWARERGNHSLHLGGGRGCNDLDPLFNFKAGFSDRRHSFYTGRWVLDQATYDRLVEERRRDTGVDAEYFPAYRAPIRTQDTADTLLAGGR